jgi:Na+:H+ antiporter, NhaA family
VFASAVIDYLLPVFFIGVGFELRQEFASGYFATRRNIFAPAAAAVVGAIAPALAYFAIAGSRGWAIPTATDIALGLAALLIFRGSKLSTLRVRFVAVATIDDLIGLGIIVVLFSSRLNLSTALIAGSGILATYALARLTNPWRHAAIVCSLLTICAAASSGVQTSIFGVLLGLVLPLSYRAGISRITNWVVVPMFAIAIGLLMIPAFGEKLNPAVFLAVAIRPAGKLLGIFVAGATSDRLISGRWHATTWVGIGILGGLGLTVSLLVAQLTFDSKPDLFASAVFGTLTAALASFVVFGVFVYFAKRRERRDAKSL